MRIKMRKNKGFTIVEVLVAAVIMSGLFASIFSLWSGQQRDMERNTKREFLQKQMRVLMGYLQKDLKAIAGTSFKALGDEHYLFSVYADGDSKNVAGDNLAQVSYWRDPTTGDVYRKYGDNTLLVGKSIESFSIISSGGPPSGDSGNDGGVNYALLNKSGVEYAGISLTVDVKARETLQGVLIEVEDEDGNKEKKLEEVEIRETETVYLRDLHNKWASQHWKTNQDYKKGLINTSGNFTLKSDAEDLFGGIVNNVTNLVGQIASLAALQDKLNELEEKEKDLMAKKAELEQKVKDLEEDIKNCKRRKDKKELKKALKETKNGLSTLVNDSLPQIREAKSQMQDEIDSAGGKG